MVVPMVLLLKMIILLVVNLLSVFFSFQTIPQLSPIIPYKIYIPSGYGYIGIDEKLKKLSQDLCRIYNEKCEERIFDSEYPQRKIYIPGYYISRYEITNRQYNRCIIAGYCLPMDLGRRSSKLEDEELPVVEVNYYEAERYCEWVKGRLPTEVEWERAARGSDTRLFPWGYSFNPYISNINPVYSVYTRNTKAGRMVYPPGSFLQDISPFKVMDMAGNVSEWTSTWFDESSYKTLSEKELLKGPSGGFLKVVRGGSFMTTPPYARVTSRWALPIETRSIEVGFRCVWDR